ncbi:MAG: hypothetical protein ABSA96_11775 [Candidatus Acidiferrales bacterium]|jgi:hypothetical protein
MELRGESRYELNAKANFTWELADHGRVQGKGITRVLSTLGAFVVTLTCPPIQTAVQVEIVLPSLPGMRTTIHLTGEARVVRVERPSGDCGEIGFAMLKHDLDRWTLLSCQSEPYRAVGRGRKSGRKHGNKYLVLDI